MGGGHVGEGVGTDLALVHPVHIYRLYLIAGVRSDGEDLAASIFHALRSAGRDAPAATRSCRDRIRLLRERRLDAVSRGHVGEGIAADRTRVYPVHIHRQHLIARAGRDGKGLAPAILHALRPAGRDAAAHRRGGGDVVLQLLKGHRQGVGRRDLLEGIGGDRTLLHAVHLHALDLVPGVGLELHLLVSAVADGDDAVYRSGRYAAPCAAGHRDGAGQGNVAEAAAVPGPGLTSAAAAAVSAVIPAVRGAVLVRRVIVLGPDFLGSIMGVIHPLLRRCRRSGIASGQGSLVLCLRLVICLLLCLQLPLKRRSLLIGKAQQLLDHVDLLRRRGLVVLVPVGIVGGGLGRGVVVPRLEGVVGPARREHGGDALLGEGGGGIAVHLPAAGGGGIGDLVGLAVFRAGGAGRVALGIRDGPAPFVFVVGRCAAASRRLLRQLLIGLVELVAELLVPGVVGDPPGRRVLRHLLRNGLSRRQRRGDQGGQHEDRGAQPVQGLLFLHPHSPPVLSRLHPGGPGCGCPPGSPAGYSYGHPGPHAEFRPP